MCRVYPEGSTDKLETWLDVDNTGTFELFFETTSERFFGVCNGVSGGGNEELTFIRVDDVGGYSGASLERAWSVPYTGGGGSTPTGTPSVVTDVDASTGCGGGGSGGGDTEPAEEEEEPDDEDSGGDDEDEGDDDNNGGDGDSPGTRSQDPTTQRINSLNYSYWLTSSWPYAISATLLLLWVFLKRDIIYR